MTLTIGPTPFRPVDGGCHRPRREEGLAHASHRLALLVIPIAESSFPIPYRPAQTCLLGQATGQCGRIARTAKRRLFPFAAPKLGKWQLQVDTTSAVTKGITIKKKKTTCLKRKRGKCVKKKVKTTRIFWFKRPTCPPAGTFSFQAFYSYGGSPPDIIKEVNLPCPKFQT